jgi:hypothetical protein
MLLLLLLPDGVRASVTYGCCQCAFDVCILSAPLGFFQERLVSFDVKVLDQISVGFEFHGVASPGDWSNLRVRMRLCNEPQDCML